MAKQTKTYHALQAELDEVLLELQSEGLDVDRATELFERGLALTGQLEQKLTEAENTVRDLKAKHES